MWRFIRLPVSLVTVRSSLKNNFCQASRGPKPNLELLEKNCFLRRFHRKVAQYYTAPTGSGTQTPGTPSRHQVIYGKKSVTRPPFISHYAIIQGEMGLFLTFSVFELQRGYLYQNGVEFRQKVIGAG